MSATDTVILWVCVVGVLVLLAYLYLTRDRGEKKELFSCDCAIISGLGGQPDIWVVCGNHPKNIPVPHRSDRMHELARENIAHWMIIEVNTQWVVICPRNPTADKASPCYCKGGFPTRGHALYHCYTIDWPTSTMRD